MTFGFRLFVMLTAIIVVPAGLDHARGQQIEREPAVEGTWLRRMLNVKDASEEVTLVVSGAGRLTLYFNGQKLAGDELLVTAPLAFDVSSLVRQRRNSIAMHWAPSANEPPKVGLLRKNGWQPVFGGWKTAPERPPIGWQTTDFNDRDWKSDDRGPQAAWTVEQSSLQRQIWQPAQKTKRVVGDHLKLQKGDHVVMLGGTFIERAQSFGFLESALKSASPDGTTFRNLGWSGDTVFADSRGIFDPVEEGYERMVEHVRAEEPDVVLVCYGQNEAMSFASSGTGIRRFEQQLTKLVGDLQTTGAEVVLISPHPFLDVKRPFPSPVRWNPDLEKIADTERVLAKRLGVLFVDLYTDFVEAMLDVPPSGLALDVSLVDHPDLQSDEFDRWTDNGMHWVKEGYRRVAVVFTERLLAASPSSPVVTIDLASRKAALSGGEDIDLTSRFNDGAMTIQLRPQSISLLPVQLNIVADDPAHSASVHVKTSTGHTMTAEVHPQVTGEGPALRCRFNPMLDELLEPVLRKNELYFHRWRPQNITYLFGFRKHEQGNNAREIAQFDPLVKELEQRIDALCGPHQLTITVTPVSGDNK